MLLLILGPAAGPPARATSALASASGSASWIVRDVKVAAGHAVFLAGGTPEGPFNLYSAPLAGGGAALLTATLPALTVESFVLSGAGRVVFAARHGADGRRYLYSVLAGGGGLSLLGPTYAAGVRGFLGSQLVFGLAGERVIFAVDRGTANAFELFSVPAAGGEPARLSPEVAPAPGAYPVPYWVTGFAINDGDARQVVFRVKAGFAPQASGFYAVPSDGSALPLFLGGGADTFDLSPDGRRLIYATDTELRSLAVDGGGDVLIARGWDIPFAITPDSARVVYIAQQEGGGGVTLKSAPTAGGDVATVAQNVRFADKRTFQITPDGGAVLYNDNDFTALLLAPVLGGQPRTVVARSVFPAVHFTEDGSRAIFGVGEEGAPALYSYSLGDGRMVRLDDPRLSAGGLLFLDGVIAQGRLIYALQAAGSQALRLYGVPVVGGASTPLSGDLGADQELLLVHGAADGSVVFSSGARYAPSSQRWRSLYIVPVDGSAAPRLVQPTVRSALHLPLLSR